VPLVRVNLAQFDAAVDISADITDLPDISSQATPILPKEILPATVELLILIIDSLGGVD